MFSFWSNDEDENSENSNESDEERDKSAALFSAVFLLGFRLIPVSSFSWKTRAISVCKQKRLS